MAGKVEVIVAVMEMLVVAMAVVLAMLEEVAVLEVEVKEI